MYVENRYIVLSYIENIWTVYRMFRTLSVLFGVQLFLKTLLSEKVFLDNQCKKVHDTLCLRTSVLSILVQTWYHVYPKAYKRFVSSIHPMLFNPGVQYHRQLIHQSRCKQPCFPFLFSRYKSFLTSDLLWHSLQCSGVRCKVSKI